MSYRRKQRRKSKLSLFTPALWWLGLFLLWLLSIEAFRSTVLSPSSKPSISTTSPIIRQNCPFTSKGSRLLLFYPDTKKVVRGSILPNHLRPFSNVQTLSAVSTSTSMSSETTSNSTKNNGNDDDTTDDVQSTTSRASEIGRIVFYPLKQVIWKPGRWLIQRIKRLVTADTEASASSTKPSSSTITSTEKTIVSSLERSQQQQASIPTMTTETAQTGTMTLKKRVSANWNGVKPKGDRWAIAAPHVDLTGEWSLIVTEEFKEQYDNYLKQLQQPWMVRSVASNIIGMTTEGTEQTDGGRFLSIRGTNVRGVWDRTLIASGTDLENTEYLPIFTPVLTADSEQVEAESWWEENGTVHVSWLRGVTKYGGGSFVSRRYLQEDGTIYVCESTFLPNNKEQAPATVTWYFRRIEKETTNQQ